MEPTNIQALMSSIFSRWNMKLDQKLLGFEFSHEHFLIFVIWRLILFSVAAKQIQNHVLGSFSVSPIQAILSEFRDDNQFWEKQSKNGHKQNEVIAFDRIFIYATNAKIMNAFTRQNIGYIICFLLFDGNESVFLSCFVCLKLKFSPRMDGIGLLAHCKNVQTSSTNVKAHTMLVELQTV